MLFKPHHPPATPEGLRTFCRVYSTKAKYFKLVDERFGHEQELVQRFVESYEFTAKLFKGERRHSGGSFMNGHLVPVSALLIGYWRSEDRVLGVAALEHDSIEDRLHITRETIKQKFGPQVAHTVDGVTKPPLNGLEPNSTAYLDAVWSKVESYGKRCIVLKCLGDRLHNLLTLYGTPEKKLHKIEETERYALPLMRRHDLPTHEMEMAIAEQKHKLHINDNDP